MNKHLFVKDATGKVSELRGRNADRVHRALAANRGQAELVRLAEAGYVEFVGKDGEARPIDSLTVEFVGKDGEARPIDSLTADQFH